MIRVLVVEDSLTVRQHLMERLAAEPDFEVVGEAADGQRAIELCQALRPDVVTMDMMLPIMNGLAATEYIMAYCPTPIVIVSSSVNRGEAFKTFDALAAGALEIVEKPPGDVPDDAWERRLLAALRMCSRIKVITHLRGKRVHRRPEAPVEVPAGSSRDACRLVAMGASTGGPAALMQILSELPPDYPLPILLVIHLSPLFSVPFVDWLNRHSAVPVAYASDGGPLPAPGRPGVVVAPHDRHLVLENGRLRLSAAPERHSCRPSVDVLFESLAREAGPGVTACLLTGMGRDGAAGLLAIRQAGGATIAQDEATSTVFGMPKEAIALDAAERILPLPWITDHLRALGRSLERRRL